MQHIRKLRNLDWLMPFIWLLLLSAVIALPYLSASKALAEDLTRFTVRLALVYYAGAATLMLLLTRVDWTAGTVRGRAARWCWTLACGTYLVHLYMAFGHYHHWSHADAVAHTQAVSGFGAGIWMSHLFTVVWSADVITWWVRPGRYAARSPWIDRILHGFMCFIIFNATVVYEQSFIRWAGILLFMELAAVWLYRLRTARLTPGLPG
ncbi:MAG TPA: hypothetical protein VG099_05345 [Gemmataceae bacterium]|jgi:hypothetical protein|nr:hypothetical protein [Gemmataceae bacterium]